MSDKCCTDSLYSLFLLLQFYLIFFLKQFHETTQAGFELALKLRPVLSLQSAEEQDLYLQSKPETVGRVSVSNPGIPFKGRNGIWTQKMPGEQGKPQGKMFQNQAGEGLWGGGSVGRTCSAGLRT